MARNLLICLVFCLLIPVMGGCETNPHGTIDAGKSEEAAANKTCGDDPNCSAIDAYIAEKYGWPQSSYNIRPMWTYGEHVIYSICRYKFKSDGMAEGECELYSSTVDPRTHIVVDFLRSQ